MPKTEHLHIRLNEEEALLLLRAIQKASRQASIKMTKSSLVLWLIKRYLKENKAT